jgi:hypothetical protein
MVTVNIFQLFYIDPHSARPDGHFGVLHDHISASIITWVPQNHQKGQNRQKCDVSCMVTMVKRSKLAVSSAVTMVTVYFFIFFSLILIALD